VPERYAALALAIKVAFTGSQHAPDFFNRAVTICLQALSTVPLPQKWFFSQ